jgi:signal transduction histidine kinase
LTELRQRVSDLEAAEEERQRTEAALLCCDSILETVRFAAERFLMEANWEQSVQEVLARLGRATGSSRVYIFENHTGTDGTLLTSQRYEWAAPGITPQIDNPQLQNFPWLAGGFARWVETMSRNEPIHGHIREFPESEREVLAAQGIKSIAVVPVFVGREWWGFIGFDECPVERVWSVAEMDALKAAATTLGAAVERERAEEALRRSLAELQGLQRIAQAVLEMRETPRLTQIAAEVIVTDLDYDVAFVFQYAEEESQFKGLALYPVTGHLGQALLALSERPAPKEKQREHLFSYHPGTNPILDRVMDGEAVISDSLADFVHPWVPRDVAGAIQELSGMQSYIGLPMRLGPLTSPLPTGERDRDLTSPLPCGERDRVRGVEGHTIGTVLAGVRRGPIAADRQQALARVASQPAIAMHHAWLFEQLRAGRKRLQALSRRLVEAQEAERRYIARELHDEVGQTLTGIKLILEMAARSPAEKVGASLGEAQALVDALMIRVRELSLDLRPAMLDDLGLLPSLLWHFGRYTAQTNVQVTFKHTGLEGRRFAPEIETAVYRIAQEGLTNVARHAGVSEATVRLWADRDRLGVQIEDRGAGFDPEAALAAGSTSGLAGMRERATLLGGQLTVESAPGTGTRLTAEVPLSGQIERREKGR